MLRKENVVKCATLMNCWPWRNISNLWQIALTDASGAKTKTNRRQWVGVTIGEGGGEATSCVSCGLAQSSAQNCQHIGNNKSWYGTRNRHTNTSVKAAPLTREWWDVMKRKCCSNDVTKRDAVNRKYRDENEASTECERVSDTEGGRKGEQRKRMKTSRKFNELPLQARSVQDALTRQKTNWK